MNKISVPGPVFWAMVLLATLGLLALGWLTGIASRMLEASYGSFGTFVAIGLGLAVLAVLTLGPWLVGSLIGWIVRQIKRGWHASRKAANLVWDWPAEATPGTYLASAPAMLWREAQDVVGWAQEHKLGLLLAEILLFGIIAPPIRLVQWVWRGIVRPSLANARWWLWCWGGWALYHLSWMPYRLGRWAWGKIVVMAKAVFAAIVSLLVGGFWAAIGVGFLCLMVGLGHLVWDVVGWSPNGWFMGDLIPSKDAWWIGFLASGLVGMFALLVALIAVIGVLWGIVWLYEHRRPVGRWFSRAWDNYHPVVIGAVAGVVVLAVIFLGFSALERMTEESWRSEAVVAQAFYYTPSAPPAEAEEPNTSGVQNFNTPEVKEGSGPVAIGDAYVAYAPTTETEPEIETAKSYEGPYGWYDYAFELAAEDGHTGAFPIVVPSHCNAELRGFEFYNEFYPLADGEDLVNGTRVRTIWQAWVCIWGVAPTQDQVQETLKENGLDDPRLLQSGRFLYLPQPIPGWTREKAG